MKMTHIHIGCAGWNISSTVQEFFPREGTHLERYAAVLPAVEINTSFYRPHKPETYARWRDSVPEDFRFSVKMPRTITHEARLRNADALLARFLGECGHLRNKLGCILVQLPPSLVFNARDASAFFDLLGRSSDVPVACEPRHPSWFGRDAVSLVGEYGVARVIADPPVVVEAEPAIEVATVYIRLHGSPHMYHSRYSDAALDAVADSCTHHLHAGRAVWCVFDNTASGAAVPNALSMQRRFSVTAAGG
jgi:uncharacterized protein YecE (DUF72 family)